MNTPYGVLVNPPNENLRWEKNGQFNVGFDFAVLKQRLSGTFEYYHKKNTDLYWLYAYRPKPQVQ
nr:TonB-dependent receptor [Sphingobacterium daejeonense]